MIVLNEFNEEKHKLHFFVTYLRKKHQFFEADGTRENPGFESAKPGKPETRVLKYRPGSDTLVLIGYLYL